jgi:tetratricopeptide (TPR) repeat protein
MGGPCRARLGLMHARAGDMQAALELFDSALALDPDDITSRRNGIVALHHMARASEASARYELMLADDPNYAQPVLEQTQVMMQPGDPGLPGSGRMERWMECDVVANEATLLSDFALSSCRILDGERFLIDGVIESPTDQNAWYQLGAFYRCPNP